MTTLPRVLLRFKNHWNKCLIIQFINHYSVHPNGEQKKRSKVYMARAPLKVICVRRQVGISIEFDPRPPVGQIKISNPNLFIALKPLCSSSSEEKDFHDDSRTCHRLPKGQGFWRIQNMHTLAMGGREIQGHFKTHISKCVMYIWKMMSI